MQEKGTISIHSENIFPIIKKFLYSDNEIFLRELVSNAVDATQKLKHLASIGEFNGELGDIKIKVSLDPEAKTITISDKGIGMTAEEIKKYINQIAFSGATEFVEKYKEKDNTTNQQIIGHFGLGFYSAYMVADTVEIQTLSHQEGSAPAKWVCDGSTSFEISEVEKTERGTDIILHVSEEGEEFLNKARLQEILDKYCKFLPIEIEFDEKIINQPNPIWTKAPADLTDEDYKAFYKELYPFAEEPLFWIHLNVDYPFNLTGVLYFPKTKNEFDFQKNKIHLYSRQVFITDEVKDIVPDFLMLLHGVIDSPDIPLNVSRSFLQADGNVRKINSHITKKVADKLNELFKNDRPAFESKWDDISLFVRYGIISDEKFAERLAKNALIKTTEGKYATLSETREALAANQTDKDGNLILLYTSDLGAQDAYIESAKNKGYEVFLFDGPVDSHYVGRLEGQEEKTMLKRVDADTVDKLIAKDEKIESVLSEDETKKVKETFEATVNNTIYTVQVESLSPSDMPVTIVLPEFMRRMKDMSKSSGMNMGSFPDQYNLVVNANHALTQKVLKGDDKSKELAQQAIDLAKLSQGLLKGKDLTNFIKRSAAIVAE